MLTFLLQAFLENKGRLRKTVKEGVVVALRLMQSPVRKSKPIPPAGILSKSPGEA